MKKTLRFFLLFFFSTLTSELVLGSSVFTSMTRKLVDCKLIELSPSLLYKKDICIMDLSCRSTPYLAPGPKGPFEPHVVYCYKDKCRTIKDCMDDYRIRSKDLAYVRPKYKNPPACEKPPIQTFIRETGSQ